MQEVGIGEQQFLDACASPFAKSKSLQVSESLRQFNSYMVHQGCIYIHERVCDEVVI